MKTSLKANLLKHLIAKKEEGGFTLIELLVVIIIIGILAAIALPSFLNQANKARQSEAKTYVGSMNRGQQAYYLEEVDFATNLSSLGLGIPETTEYYKYEAVDLNNGTADIGVTNRAITWKDFTGDNAGSEDQASPVRSYLGGVVITEVIVGTNATSGEPTTETTTTAVLCEADAAPVNGGETGIDDVIGLGSIDVTYDDGGGGTATATLTDQPSCDETTGYSGV